MRISCMTVKNYTSSSLPLKQESEILTEYIGKNQPMSNPMSRCVAPCHLFQISKLIYKLSRSVQVYHKGDTTMKHIRIGVLGCLVMLHLYGSEVVAASARCEVVRKEGNVLIMDCGERADGFTEKSRVKIKTDRDTESSRQK